MSYKHGENFLRIRFIRSILIIFVYICTPLVVKYMKWNVKKEISTIITRTDILPRALKWDDKSKMRRFCPGEKRKSTFGLKNVHWLFLNMSESLPCLWFYSCFSDFNKSSWENMTWGIRKDSFTKKYSPSMY